MLMWGLPKRERVTNIRLDKDVDRLFTASTENIAFFQLEQFLKRKTKSNVKISWRAKEVCLVSCRWIEYCPFASYLVFFVSPLIGKGNLCGRDVFFFGCSTFPLWCREKRLYGFMWNDLNLLEALYVHVEIHYTVVKKMTSFWDPHLSMLWQSGPRHLFFVVV